MNPNLCRIELRPRGPLEVFDLTWRFLGQHAGVYARLTALIGLPLWFLCLPIGWFTDWHWGVGAGLAVAATALRAPYTLLTGRLMFADRVPLRTVLLACLRAVPRLLAMGLLQLLLAASAVLSCGVTGLFGWFLLAWQLESLVLEQRAGGLKVGAMWAGRRSWNLAAQSGVGAIAAVVGGLFLLGWFALMAEACGQAGLSFVLQMGSPLGQLQDLQATPWVLLGLVLAQPVISAYRLLLYVDTRTRAEGWDLQVSLRALGLT